MHRRRRLFTFNKPQPDINAGDLSGTPLRAIGIGWTKSLNSMEDAVASNETSFVRRCLLYRGWLTIVWQLIEVPPESNVVVPVTITKSSGWSVSVQWAAVRIHMGWIIDPPQKWLRLLATRSETMYGNCPRAAAAPPTIRSSALTKSLRSTPEMKG